jgi:DNA uptake protein ComE-like DNA-binding protein
MQGEHERIDLNSASLDQLEHIPGVDEQRAHEIIDHRPYNSFEDVRKVPGFSDDVIQNLKSYNADVGEQPMSSQDWSEFD